MISGIALLAVAVQGAKLSGDLDDMYKDPEYANTWRWTNDHRYVEEGQWAKDSPSGYKDHLGLIESSFIQNLQQGTVPDYWTHDYSGNKHWGFAADPFYGDNEAWVESSPKGYDDYVRLQSGSQVNLGVTFYPGMEPKGLRLTQAKSTAEVPDYWTFDYSGNKHWKFANDPFYADPDEWIKSAPAAYDSFVQMPPK